MYSECTGIAISRPRVLVGDVTQRVECINTAKYRRDGLSTAPDIALSSLEIALLLYCASLGGARRAQSLQRWPSIPKVPPASSSTTSS